MNLLENALIRKYFSDCFAKGCPDASTITHDREGCFATSVIRAMSWPIEKGEKYISYWFPTHEISEEIAVADGEGPYHPGMLRVPDKLQPRNQPTTDDLIEHRIKVFKDYSHNCGFTEHMILLTETDLRKLVDLARGNK